MKHLIAAVLLFGGTLLMGQDTSRARVEGQGQADRIANPEVTFARVKEFNAGKKLVLDVDNAVDKSFDLSKSDPTVNVPAGLKVGDPVKITEHTVNGKKTFDVAMDSEGGAKHGDKTRSEEKR